jgi:formylglycine-generating enzyme required for sulfatase activity
MGETEVTQAQFEYVMGNSSITPYFYCGHGGATDVANRPTSNLPVEYVNWYAAIAYCNKLSLLEGLEPCYSVKVGGVEVDWENININSAPLNVSSTNSYWNDATCDFSKNGYRLPTGWEFEYAARGGMQKAHHRIAGSYYGDIINCTPGDNQSEARDSLCLVAWFGNNNNDAAAEYSCGAVSPFHGTKPVKTKRANVFGLYDMAGNLDEWCYEWSDRLGDDGVSNHPFRTPIGIDTQPTSSSVKRILKGGSWFHLWSVASNKCSYRVGQRSDATPHYYASPYRGFRVVMSK